MTNYGYPDDVLFSFFGRANYDFDSKYLFSATFRADGSSKFAKGNQWGFFPSAAVAWRISSESVSYTHLDVYKRQAFSCRESL